MTGCNYKGISYVPLFSDNNRREQCEEDTKWKWPSIVIIFWIVTFILAGLVYVIDFLQLQSFAPFNKITELSKVPELPQQYNTLNGYLINTPGCRIPQMYPFDPTVNKFIFEPSQAICNKGLPPLFRSNLTSLSMITENLLLYNVTNTRNIACSYKEFWREEPAGDKRDTQIAYSENWVPLNASVTHMNGEFIKVLCKTKSDGNQVYEDYYSFVPPKKQVELRITSTMKPNILVLGLDAVSRVNLRRQLPNTYKYLTQELGGVELLGYNKVADNTFVNLVPVLTGMFQRELQRSCWPSTNDRFDNCSFLWSNFSSNDYVTAFGEDCSSIGMFNFEKKGFIKQPTDYYYTSFNGELESNIGDDRDFNCVQCVGGRETYKVILDYVQKFVIRMNLELTPYFGFFWSTTLSHDYLNRPSLGDRTYLDLFSSLKEEGYLENTILIFMSDHGIRWGDIRQTYQGQMEERLPFVFMVLPEWFKEKYPAAVKNLNKNARRLTTPFDLHETLKEFLDLNKLKNVGKISNVARGYSLFNEISTERTCEAAEIDSHWCTCQQSVEVLINDTQVIAAAEFAVNDINSQLNGYAQCATLALDSVLHARVLYYDSEYFTDKKSVKDYTVTLQTMPGDGVFEVTVRYRKYQHEGELTRSKLSVDQWANFHVTGTVSRLNLYGKQSHCITDFHLKLYCYCKSLLKM